MSEAIKRVVVTGGAGHIAYSLLFRIANGDMLGKDQPISLNILEIPQAMSVLEGVKMELQDSAFPLLKEVKIGSDPIEIFEGADYALMVGSKPRGPGMERSDLLADNGKIFVEQGKALDKVASKEVIVLVVGNPCNTNCLICMNNAPSIPRKNFHAMTLLDQNRASAQLAQKAEVDIEKVTNVVIWGNHSNTQVPDFYHALINGIEAPQVIDDEKWFLDSFLPTVQTRGSAIIKARGSSSAASAANAAICTMKSIVFPTEEGLWFSSAVSTDQNPYGIEKNLIFSFPCFSKGMGQYDIVPGIEWNDFLSEKIKLSEKELIEERNIVESLMAFSK